ncbi:MAG: hypothetical protein WA056_02300 [Gallionella sp.]
MIYGPKSQKGFTGIELLSVVAIGGILSILAVGLMQESGKKAKFTEVVKAVEALKTDIEVCYAQTHDLTQCQNGMNGVRAELGSPGRLTTGDNSDYGANANLGKHTAWLSTTARGAAAAGGVGGGMPPEVIEPTYKWYVSSASNLAGGNGLYDTPEAACASLSYTKQVDVQGVLLNVDVPVAYDFVGNTGSDVKINAPWDRSFNFDAFSPLNYNDGVITSTVVFNSFTRYPAVSTLYEVLDYQVNGIQTPVAFTPYKACVQNDDDLLRQIDSTLLNQILAQLPPYHYDGNFWIDSIKHNQAWAVNEFSFSNDLVNQWITNWDKLSTIFESKPARTLRETVAHTYKISHSCPAGYTPVNNGNTVKYKRGSTTKTYNADTQGNLFDSAETKISNIYISGVGSPTRSYLSEYAMPGSAYNGLTPTYIDQTNPNLSQFDIFDCALTDPQAAIDAGIGGAGGGAIAVSPTQIVIYASALGTDIDTASDGMNGEDIRLIGTVGSDGSIGWTIDPNSTCAAGGICKP